jgi:hypothetical protein
LSMSCDIGVTYEVLNILQAGVPQLELVRDLA